MTDLQAIAAPPQPKRRLQEEAQEVQAPSRRAPAPKPAAPKPLAKAAKAVEEAAPKQVGIAHVVNWRAESTIAACAAAATHQTHASDNLQSLECVLMSSAIHQAACPMLAKAMHWSCS